MSLKEFVKIAVGLREHPKVLQAGDDGGWLFVCAIMWSKEHDTDGFVPAYALTRLTGLKQPSKIAARLVAAGLFEVADGGWMVHDYLEIQESSQKRRDAGRKAAEARWEKERAKQTQNDTDANRTAIAMRNRNAEEEEEEESPVAPQGESNEGGTVVTFDRRPVPTERLALAERLLDEFNRQAGTSYSAFTGRGRPSEDLRRIIGALTDATPPLDFDEAQRMIAARLANPFWEGRPHTGVVFGPKVFASNRESAAGPNGTTRSTETAALAAALRRDTGDAA